MTIHTLYRRRDHPMIVQASVRVRPTYAGLLRIAAADSTPSQLLSLVRMPGSRKLRSALAEAQAIQLSAVYVEAHNLKVIGSNPIPATKLYSIKSSK